MSSNNGSLDLAVKSPASISNIGSPSSVLSLELSNSLVISVVYEYVTLCVVGSELISKCLSSSLVSVERISVDSIKLFNVLTNDESSVSLAVLFIPSLDLSKESISLILSGEVPSAIEEHLDNSLEFAVDNVSLNLSTLELSISCSHIVSKLLNVLEELNYVSVSLLIEHILSGGNSLVPSVVEKNFLNGLTLSSKNCKDNVSLCINSVNCSIVAGLGIENCVYSVSVNSSGESDSVLFVKSNDLGVLITVVEVLVYLGVEVSGELYNCLNDKIGSSVPVLNYNVSNVRSSLSFSELAVYVGFEISKSTVVAAKSSNYTLKSLEIACNGIKLCSSSVYNGLVSLESEKLVEFLGVCANLVSDFLDSSTELSLNEIVKSNSGLLNDNVDVSELVSNCSDGCAEFCSGLCVALSNSSLEFSSSLIDSLVSCALNYLGSSLDLSSEFSLELCLESSVSAGKSLIHSSESCVEVLNSGGNSSGISCIAVLDKLFKLFLCSCEVVSSLLSGSLNISICLTCSIVYSVLCVCSILVNLNSEVINLTTGKNEERNDHQACKQNGQNVSFHDFVSFH